MGENDEWTASVAYDGGGTAPKRAQAAVNNEKCPGCGDNMRFDPASGRLKCPSCGTVKDIFAQAGKELDFRQMAKRNEGWAQETHVYHCSNCNAEDVLDKREIAHVCPFCGSPNVVEKEEFSSLRPNSLLPFAVDKNKASEITTKWAKKRIFAPRDFKDYFRPEALNGVYLPAFTFDTQTRSSYSGRLGEYYYTTRTDKNGNTTRVRHTRYFFVSGEYRYAFDDLAVNAASAVPEKIMDTLLFYDYENSVEYKEEFLYGFSALLYSKDGETCWEKAKSDANAVLRNQILSQYHHDVVDRFDVRTDFFDVKYRYLLLPMYIGNYLYRNKSYSFYINGRNGKTKGKAPVSPIKAGLTALACLAVAALVGVAAYFIGM